MDHRFEEGKHVAEEGAGFGKLLAIFVRTKIPFRKGKILHFSTWPSLAMERLKEKYLCKSVTYGSFFVLYCEHLALPWMKGINSGLSDRVQLFLILSLKLTPRM